MRAESHCPPGFVAAAILRPSIVLFCATIAGCGHAIANPRPFDAELWKSLIADRAEMVGDLERSHLRTGMTEADVLKLLGEPDRRHGRDEVVQPRRDATWYLRYELDIDDVPSAFDSAEFIVILSAEGVVVDYSMLAG